MRSRSCRRRVCRCRAPSATRAKPIPGQQVNEGSTVSFTVSATGSTSADL